MSIATCKCFFDTYVNRPSIFCYSFSSSSLFFSLFLCFIFCPTYNFHPYSFITFFLVDFFPASSTLSICEFSPDSTLTTLAQVRSVRVVRVLSGEKSLGCHMLEEAGVLIPGINSRVNGCEVLLSTGKMACGLPQPSCEKPQSTPVSRVKVGVAEPLGDALTLMTGVLPSLSEKKTGLRDSSASLSLLRSDPRQSPVSLKDDYDVPASSARKSSIGLASRLAT